MLSPEFRLAERLAEPLINAGHAYDYGQTPAKFYADTSAGPQGINCKVVPHEFARQQFGIELPPELQIAEAFFGADNPASPLRRLHPSENLRLGDWILYGRQDATHPQLIIPDYGSDGNMRNWRNFPINHVGVFLGTHHGQPMILHATPEHGVTIAEQRTIQRSRRTAQVHDVLRLKVR